MIVVLIAASLTLASGIGMIIGAIVVGTTASRASKRLDHARAADMYTKASVMALAAAVLFTASSALFGALA